MDGLRQYADRQQVEKLEKEGDNTLQPVPSASPEHDNAEGKEDAEDYLQDELRSLDGATDNRAEEAGQDADVTSPNEDEAGEGKDGTDLEDCLEAQGAAAAWSATKKPQPTAQHPRRIGSAKQHAAGFKRRSGSSSRPCGGGKRLEIDHDDRSSEYPPYVQEEVNDDHLLRDLLQGFAEANLNGILLSSQLQRQRERESMEFQMRLQLQMITFMLNQQQQFMIMQAQQQHELMMQQSQLFFMTNLAIL